ncbi:MAG: hypothetical protein AAF718_11280 [Pseudomonadota bacterium]
MTVTFEAALRDALTDLDIDLPHGIWEFIAWLEERGHRSETLAGLPFLTIAEPDVEGNVWSELFFDLPPDLVRFWFGRDGLEKQVIPFVHCGGDGSYIALWRHAGAPDRFVFLGSEGEAFTIAEDVQSFLTIVTMGYPMIEGRDNLTATPEHLWDDINDEEPWPDTPAVKAWIGSHFGISHPMTASILLPYSPGEDPFEAFVLEQSGAAA